jgi:GTP cyclohydrolase IA
MDESLRVLVKNLLKAVGENPERAELIKTPERFLGAFWELTSSYRTDPTDLINSALYDSPNDELVVIESLAFQSLCEHHLLPFFGQISIAYLPNKKIIGVGRVPKLINFCGAKLQLQERLNQEIHDLLDSILKPHGLLVVMKGQHLCSMMLGNRPNFTLTTTTTSGKLKGNLALRSDLLNRL